MEKKAVLSRKQLHRLTKISALLKGNRYPNPKILVAKFRQMHLEEENALTCGEKTVLRDIKVLKEEFDCPIKYSRERRGYYLKHHNWNFICPALLDENEMIATVLGAKLAEDILPDPISSKISCAVDELLKQNNPDFLDTACLESLKIFAYIGVTDISKIFPIVFNAWQRHHSLHIEYNDVNGQTTERDIDPHVLVLFDKVWNVKAYCHKRQAVRTFVIDRIKSAIILPETFEPDQKIIDSVTLDSFWGFKKIVNVKVRLSPIARKFALSRRMHSHQSIIPDTDGESFILSVPEVAPEVIVPWILSLEGEAIPLAPIEIINAVKNAAIKIINAC